MATNSNDGPVITAVEVSRVFGSGATAVTALSAISLTIVRGEFLAVTGRSGSGKTTLLNLLSGLDRPSTGTVHFNGNDLAELRESDLVEMRRHKIGFVFQSFGLMPLLSAQENVELPLHIGGMSWRERRQRATEALQAVGLGTRARHRPYELSGGEQQRVSIARALVAQPEVVFADEPTGELDTATARSIAETLGDVAASRRATVIVATHDLDLAAMAQRRLDLVDGEDVTQG
ncbi:MAG: ABC transporter ATP-binding protein [SAR202 cluster bacterium]|jgi:putative ABC transport system ATP-binding protein|nr:macrolide ABC transporter ATP-binding protein [Chloroflexota bacterium]MCH2509213.1 ABC transporter ATP-binding protein [Dehalococcoidia bacterium]MQG48788.1 ABC transporter ATP-binding protein [SAR202 cluster bacterium]MCS5655655.1 ABC transporter ATP-binding protein [Dehalococcoidia bacterium]MEC7747795.1 ABC transporter ATP-binding protein [Chloroflexota bacterium]|tara:strand:+ start:2334 stop:3032 length:699 start_codon:yes stop_codon:yes gene_type:complete